MAQSWDSSLPQEDRMRRCSECGSEIKTSYAWSLDDEPVCSACMRAAVPEFLWCLVEAVERIMEPVYRAHSEAMRN